MASITRHPNGRREVQFIGVDGKRRTIRLGKVDQKMAESSRLRIDELNAAKIHGASVSPSTSQWLREIGDALHDRLVRAGLCLPRVTVASAVELPLEKMLDDYIARRDDVKPGTRTIYLQSKQHLERFFGAARSVRSITLAEAGDFRRAIRKQYSEAYTAKLIIKARTFWRDAVDRGLVESNVFAKVQAGSQVNAANQRFIDRGTIENVIAACPDPQWKLLLALSRYAGLRCPSEHLALRWADVDWAKGQLSDGPGRAVPVTRGLPMDRQQRGGRPGPLLANDGRSLREGDRHRSENGDGHESERRCRKRCSKRRNDDASDRTEFRGSGKSRGYSVGCDAVRRSAR